MNPIKITFSPALPASSHGELPQKGQALTTYLQERLLSELDREIRSNEHRNKDFINRRSAAGHLRWQFLEGDGQSLSLEVAPRPRLYEAFDHSPELCRIWLQNEVGTWLQQQWQWEAEKISAEVGQWPKPEVQAVSKPRNGLKLLAVIAVVGFLLVMGTLAFTLYRTYRLVDDVQSSYTQIENTVDKKTDEILDKIERSITTSDRVVNMMDKVKDLVVPEE